MIHSNPPAPDVGRCEILDRCGEPPILNHGDGWDFFCVAICSEGGRVLVYAGIDEAGYGPMLGPLVVGCTVFTIQDYDEATAAKGGAPKMWGMLRRAVARDIKGANGRIIVNDSKKLKLPNSNLESANAKHPLTHLEHGVLAFLQSCAGAENDLPDTDRDFLKRVVRKTSSGGAHGGGSGHSLKWYEGDAIELPVAHDPAMLRIAANSLARALSSHGIQMHSMACKFLAEPEFNEVVERMHTKAAANFMLIGQHIAEIFQTHGEHHPRIIVDRQSSRLRYLELLHTLFPEAEERIVAEDDRFSRYHLRDRASKRQMTITFTKSAEEKHLPVALASMLAKYVREIFMMRFNRFFRTLAPEVKPTAGYVQDARRFLTEIKPFAKQAGLDHHAFVRKC